MPIHVPEALVASLVEWHGADGRAWADGLPALAAASADRWGLRPDGPPAHGAVGLVLPVRRADGSRAVLKLQRADEETAGEPLALRAWNGRGAVRLLDHDPDTGSMLLERLDPARSLLALPDDRAATLVLADLLAELTEHQAPPGLRTLAEVADGMLAEVPAARERLAGRPTADCWRIWRPPSARSGPNRATACCTGTCTTAMCSPRRPPTRGRPGSPSTPSPWRATRASNSSRPWGTAGPTSPPQVTSREPCACASTC